MENFYHIIHIKMYVRVNCVGFAVFAIDRCNNTHQRHTLTSTKVCIVYMRGGRVVLAIYWYTIYILCDWMEMQTIAIHSYNRHMFCIRHRNFVRLGWLKLLIFQV